ncbi:hypothetical protein PV10_01874 [Exophiala mesophila]|uniref:RGS domain-containing protein n=1 Tax=Exophiala mesophila TaxID=212818 RepID=A0A0D1ZUJ0_EXOME|nr:uncharacterized protein PV10_01874 [Exophiala mesophila]KIV98197.1 hypothetical protein PV10_01874 [Exophiala mesophila]
MDPPFTHSRGARPRAVDNGDQSVQLQSFAYAQGYDMALRYNTDGLGMTYVGIVVAWTCLLLPATILLIRNRHLPYLRMRNIPLCVSAVATLHVYWVLCMIAYLLNGYFPCPAEYWIMSIYLPLGIALFQATNCQLLSIAAAQSKYAQGDVVVHATAPLGHRMPTWRKWWARLKAANATRNTMTWIGIGMLVQVVVSLVVFLVSKKFHPSFGVPGTELRLDDAVSGGDEAARLACRRGWEWWPSIVWQLFWSWIYAPVLLWRVRRVDDVHGWRAQTMVCIISGLPASPMWLIALYVPGMNGVNKFFGPPLWFSASIVLMQSCVIFVPFFQIFRHRRLEAETREIIAQWEQRQKLEGSILSASQKTSTQSRFSTKSAASTASGRHGEMYTMSTLERTLQLNPKPLLMFSALRDFSGENISFLVHVRKWKANWNSNPSKNKSRKHELTESHDQTLLRQQFKQAVGIYASFVSLKYSDFPINISSAQLRDLEGTFEQYAALVCAEPASNAATPFEMFWSSTISEDPESQTGKDQLSIVSTVVGDGVKDDITPIVDPVRQLQELNMTNFGERLPSNIAIPDSFGPNVFDRAELSIKELVLTNTWAKFVKEGFAQQQNEGFRAQFEASLRACYSMLPKLSLRRRAAPTDNPLVKPSAGN